MAAGGSIDALSQFELHPALGHIELVAQPMFLSRTPSSLRTATPERGEHTDEILRGLGYDRSAIGRLRTEKIVA